MYKEIFERQIFKFNAKTSTPTIIDCGANVGLSILYFKFIFPDSHIIAFEPDKDIFTVLKNNVERFNLSKVKLLNKAVWSKETTLNFIPDGADSGRVAITEKSPKSFKVPTATLSDYITPKIDLLKLDVEGAETEVLVECQNKLENVENLFVEYHSFVNNKQTIHTIIEILTKAQFNLHFHTPMKSMQPFFCRKVFKGMDMQINIFAYR